MMHTATAASAGHTHLSRACIHGRLQHTDTLRMLLPLMRHKLNSSLHLLFKAQHCSRLGSLNDQTEASAST